jgi:hypothetical protein
MPGSDSPYPAWRMHAVVAADTASPVRRRAAGMRLLTGELFQIGFDFADLIGDHAFQMA